MRSKPGEQRRKIPDQTPIRLDRGWVPVDEAAANVIVTLKKHTNKPRPPAPATSRGKQPPTAALRRAGLALGHPPPVGKPPRR